MPNANPRVSVIMTVYNHERFVKDAIESVLDQSFRDYEIIIINDGSTDNTKDVIESYRPNKRIIIRNIDHVGRQKALNFGFRLSKGEYITVLDSDDLYLKDKVKKQVAYLDENPDIVLVGTDAIEIDLMNNKRYINMPPTCDKEIRKLLLYKAVFPFPVIMTRRDLLKDIGYCNEKLVLKEDFELFGKIASKGKIANIPEALVIIRRHPQNNFRLFDSEQHRRSMLKVRWLNLWRLKPNFPVFIRIFLWLSFEFFVNLFPEKIRHLLPENLRGLLKNSKIAKPKDYFDSSNSYSISNSVH
ncbi:MAG: glycosyltransferase family 2 protein [Candidatus Sifarchaeia archaeon]